MPHIAVITDSDSSLSEKLAAQYGILQVPISVHFGDETYDSGINISDKELFTRIDREGKLPTTSAPAPHSFMKAYQQAFDSGADEILCITVSSIISTTHQSAVIACEGFENRKIMVIDSKNLSMGQGFMVLTAARAIQEGKTIEEAAERAISIGKRSSIFGSLSTLRYLAMSGRVGKLAAGMAGLFNIRPILTSKDGKLEMLEKIRTRSRAWSRVIDLAEESLEGKAPEALAIVQSNCAEEAAEFQQELSRRIPLPAENYIMEFTAGLSVHSGSGLIGVVTIRPE